MTKINGKNRRVLRYPDLEPARCSVASFDKCSAPACAMLSDDSNNGSTTAQESQDVEKSFLQNELNDLVCNLNLSNSQRSSWHPDQRKKVTFPMAHASLFIVKGIKSSFIFSFEEKILVYCTDIVQKLGVPYFEPRDWRLFINSCKRSFLMCSAAKRKPVCFSTPCSLDFSEG